MTDKQLDNPPSNETKKYLSRRDFLKLSFTAGVGLFLGSCGVNTTSPAPLTAETPEPVTPTSLEPTKIPPKETVTTPEAEIPYQIIDGVNVYGMDQKIKTTQDLDTFIDGMNREFSEKGSERDPSVRVTEMYVPEWLYLEFQNGAISLPAWLKKQADKLNDRLQNAPLPAKTKAELSRVIVLEDSFSKDKNWHKPYLTNDTWSWWIMEGDYRQLSSYYSPEDDIDYGLLHEWGHTLLGLQYHSDSLEFDNDKGDQCLIYQNLDPQVFKLRYPQPRGGSLMLGGKSLQDYDALVLQQMSKVGVGGFLDRWGWWQQSLQTEVADESRVSLKTNDGTLLTGKVDLFISSRQTTDKGTVKKFDPTPSYSFDLDESGNFSIPKGTLNQPADIEWYTPLNKNYLMRLSTPSGKTYLASASIRDFQCAHWRKENQVAQLNLIANKVG